ncbi:AfsR/SARP family transcriptional regulator [Paractinoplanes atraurantiacus]|uniref:DNA-binding transcriptional activator of the SARP family n=1 Tax=Paractinoplanes atraurantiacus TaxID=1036182 RepID=A0A285KBE8_9ACTN|nr:AfsR/SARP family transcriptional regulator [Actinoplanes atraurantiacus]SNY69888.1 DNA-binding transcriptional activator of the SARP family [Actinoplanes atraurantiacus]
MPDDPDVLRLRILGPLRVLRGGDEVDAGPRQQRCLLAVLLALHDRPVSLTELIGMLWGDDAPATAANVVHKYIGALRRLLEPGLPARATGSRVLRDGNGYRLSAGPGELDLIEFRALVAEARRESDLDRYVEALALWHGPAGGDLGDSAAATAVFAGLHGEFLDAVSAAAFLAIERGKPDAVLSPLRQAASTNEFNEAVHASLIAVLAAAGHRAEALGTYQSIRARLHDDLGLDPGPDLRRAQLEVLTETEPRVIGQPAQLPPDLALFTGRDSELGLLRRLTSEGAAGGPLVVALDGMAGVGKSTLAVHFAHGAAGRFPDGQLYLDLRGHQEESLPPADAVVALLHGLGVAAADIPASFEAQVGAYRSLTAGKRILVLLDNARDAEQVRPLLPAAAGSLVLVTSRRPLITLAALHGARQLHLDPPDPAAARELLRRRLAAAPNRIAAKDDAESAALEEILDSCGRLPLALSILAARLGARPGLTLATVAAELRNSESRLDAFPRGENGDPRNAFIWSYRQLSPGAARMFRLFSVPLADGVSAGACAALAGEPLAAARDELAELTEAALLIEDDQGRFTAHVLIRAYAAELFRAVETEAERRDAVGRMLQYYLYSSLAARAALGLPDRDEPAPVLPPPPPGLVPESPGSPDEARQWFSTEHPILREAIRWSADLGYGIEPWQLAAAVQPYLRMRGYFHDAEDVVRTALAAARDRGDRDGEARMLRARAGARSALDG